VTGAALLFVLQFLGAVFGIPTCLRNWFCTPGGGAKATAHYVVVLGGGGIPSATGLMRTYYAARLASACTGAVFVVALPADGDPEAASTGKMRDELVMRGVPASSILMEHRGLNTHEQAVNTRRLLGEEAVGKRVVVATSPSHVRRAVLCFRKEGFAVATGLPAFSTGAEADLGRGTGIRYSFWANLETQVVLAREGCALLYYKMRGWI